MRFPKTRDTRDAVLWLFNPGFSVQSLGVPHRTLIGTSLAALAGANLCCAAEPQVTEADLPRIPATEPPQALQTFRTKPGFELQLAAAEPLVMDPVAMDFDESGRLFVAEMRDYSERRDERLGRIRVLEDTDGDGRFDRSTVLADDIPWPTAVVCYDGGVFVGTTPDILFLKDTTGDQKADLRETVFTGFAVGSLQRLNVQALLNSFHWGLDNRIHGSASLSSGTIVNRKLPQSPAVELRGRDFSFDPRTWDFRTETGGGQHGMSFDDYGRKFLCSNSDHIQVAVIEDRYLGRNPSAELPTPRESIAVDGPAAEVFRLSPDEPWRVIRTRWRVTGAVPGLIEGGGRPSGYFTGATGVTIYRGHAFPSDYLGDAFVADCGSNLIHHKKVRRQGIRFQAERPADEQRTEFVASTDNWFRPVQFANAPDGTLYVADMYRETIEHPWSIPASLKQHLDLNSGNNRGRIYRIVPRGFVSPKPPRLGELSAADCVRTLEHPNGWHRDTAARMLFQRQDRSVVPALIRTAQESTSARGRIHALWALAGLNAASEPTLVIALKDPAPEVREQALKLLEVSPPKVPSSQLREALSLLAVDTDARVRNQLAWTLSLLDWPEEGQWLKPLAEASGSDPALVPALLNAAGAHASEVLHGLLASQPPGKAPAPLLSALARMIGLRRQPAELTQLTGTLAARPPSLLSISLLADLAAGLTRVGDSLLAGGRAEALEAPLAWAKRQVSAEVPPGADRSSRAAALRLMGTLPFPQAVEPLLAALGSNGSVPEQQTAVQSLANFSAPELGTKIVQSWDTFGRGIRSDLLGLLIRRKPWITALLEGVEQGKIARAELSAAQVQSLRAEKDPVLHQKVVSLLGEAKTSQRQEVVNRYLPALARPGDPTRGQRVYEQRCATCHRLGEQGRAVGPDFQSVRSMGKEKLLTQILDPNREVAPNFQAYQVETTSGENYTGLLLAETATEIRLKTADAVETPLGRNQIKSLVPGGMSLMPEGLEEGISEQDMADLLELLTGGR